MTRQREIQLSSLGLFAIGVLAGGVMGLKHFMGIELADWAKLVVLVVALVMAAVLTWTWWKSLDEVAREAHKFAWYWGGSAGMAVAGALMILVDSGRIAAPQILLHGSDSAFAAGAMTVLGAEVIGYLVAWAGWWWSHR